MTDRLQCDYDNTVAMSCELGADDAVTAFIAVDLASVHALIDDHA